MVGLLLAAFGVLLLAGCEFDKAEYLVDTTADALDANPGDGVCDTGTGECSLRAAVMESNADGEQSWIYLQSGATYTLSLAGTGEDAAVTGDLDLTGDTLIAGGGTIDAAGLDRVIDIHGSSGSISIIGDVTLTGGSEATGGAVRASGGAVGFRQTEITANTATTGAPVEAVGATSMAFSGATVADNTGVTAGGVDVADSSAGLQADALTISGNTATAGPGGLRLGGGGVLRFSAISDNSGTTAGGIEVLSGASLQVNASVLVDQAAGDDCAGAGSITSGDHNLESGTSCGFTEAGDTQDATGVLQPLVDNGGPTRTHAPSLDGPAVDHVPVAACVEPSTEARTGAEQRTAQGAACDAGPIEIEQLTVTHGGDASGDTSPGDGTCQDTGGAGGDCSLRAAIDEANALDGPQIIDLAGGDVTLTDAGGDLDIGDVTLVAAKGATITQTVAGERVIHVTAPVTITDATITGGSPAGDGGGVYVSGATTLERVQITGNTAGSYGGALRANAPTTIIESTVSGNTAASGGAFLASAPIVVTNSTISGNTTGGTTNTAVRVFTAGSVSLTASTVTDNTGGNLRGTGGGITLAGSIVADPATGPNCTSSGFTSNGHNLASDASCALTGTGDQPSTVADLGPLADNGGPTSSHLPGAGSPAIDAVPAGTGALCDGTLPTDQRGVARPQGVGCDVGAVEAHSFSFSVDDGGDSRDAAPGDGICDDGTGACTLRAAIDETNALAGEQTITVDPAVTLITLARPGLDDTNDKGDLDITDPVTIVGNGATLLGGPATDGIFQTDTDLAISDLTLSEGYAGNGPGGAILAEGGFLDLDATAFVFNETDHSGGAVALTGTATASITDTSFAQSIAWGGSGGAIWVDAGVTDVHLADVVIDNNTADRLGGAIAATDGQLTIEDSLLTDNRAYDGGGGISISGAATATITGTELRANGTFGGDGGGLLVGSGVSDVEITNSTISDNTASGQGGGVYASDGASATFRFATLVNETGDHLVTDPTGQMHVAASIISSPGANCPAAPGNNVTSQGHNIASDTSCFAATGTDLVDTDPLLAPVDPATAILVPHGTSPAVDHIPAATAALCDGTIPLDTRGADRTSGACDAGSVERHTTDRDCGGPYLPPSDLRDCDLSGLAITGADLTGSLLTGADLTGTDLTGTDLTGVIDINTTTGRCTVTYNGVTVDGLDLSGCDLTDAGLRGATLTNADLSNVILGGADLDGAILTGIDLTGADIAYAGLTNVDLTTAVGINTTTGRCDTYWRGTTVVGLDLSGCFLDGKDFTGATLTDVNLTGAYFNTDFTGADLTGAVGINTATGRCQNIYTGATIDGLDLSGCDFTQGNFRGPTDDLTGATLTNVNLTGADLTGVNLTDANLSGTVGINTATGSCTVTYIGATVDGVDVSGCDLTGIDLTGATLAGIDLTDANLTDAVGINTTTGRCTITYTGVTIRYLELLNCDLTGADFSGARLPNLDVDDTTLTNADFTGAYLRNATFDYGTVRSADFSSADLRSVIMSGVDARDIILTDAMVDGVVFWVSDLTGAVGFSTTIGRCGVNISASTFPNVDYSGCEILYFFGQAFDYRGGDFSNTTGGWFYEGNMTDVNGTGMQVDNFTNINATRITMVGADLRDAPAYSSTFVDADLTDAQIGGTSFANANLTRTDLTGATGTPSSITDTTFSDTTCPTGVNSDSNGGTCAGQWLP